MDASTWNSLIATLPQPHILQTWEWGQVKALYGWQPDYRTWLDEVGQVKAAALILTRTASFGLLRVLYLPKGPLLDWHDAALRRRVLADLKQIARQQGALFIKVDPDVVLGRGIPGSINDCKDETGQAVADELRAAGWRFSQDQIQFRNTVEIDLRPSEEALLANMKQKTRYNIRLAERKGVQVRVGGLADLPLLYTMYAETSLRDGFIIRSEGYYRSVWSRFFQSGLAEPLIAEVEGEPVAAIVVFHFGERAWYIYGMSRDRFRERMPNYLLQWQAMRRARQAGCRVYDLWGAPEQFEERDKMWGVFRFKEGLGGQVTRTLGAWDYPVQPQLYQLYTQTLPRWLEMMRRRRRKQISEELEARQRIGL